MRRVALLLALAGGCAAPGAAVRPGSGGATTRFLYRGPADEVWVAGSMSAWKPVPLSRDEGAWELVLPLAPGRYEYRLEVRDGRGVRTVLPPGAERADDGFGGENAILRVER